MTSLDQDEWLFEQVIIPALISTFPGWTPTVQRLEFKMRAQHILRAIQDRDGEHHARVAVDAALTVFFLSPDARRMPPFDYKPNLDVFLRTLMETANACG
jgi:hypothetical protein